MERTFEDWQLDNIKKYSVFIYFLPIFARKVVVVVKIRAIENLLPRFVQIVRLETTCYRYVSCARRHTIADKGWNLTSRQAARARRKIISIPGTPLHAWVYEICNSLSRLPRANLICTRISWSINESSEYSTLEAGEGRGSLSGHPLPWHQALLSRFN